MGFQQLVKALLCIVVSPFRLPSPPFFFVLALASAHTGRRHPGRHKESLVSRPGNVAGGWAMTLATLGSHADPHLLSPPEGDRIPPHRKGHPRGYLFSATNEKVINHAQAILCFAEEDEKHVRNMAKGIARIFAHACYSHAAQLPLQHAAALKAALKSFGQVCELHGLLAQKDREALQPYL
ncbi:hypothetical protein QOT17_016281 [Balamuthia mandrillaris]